MSSNVSKYAHLKFCFEAERQVHLKKMRKRKTKQNLEKWPGEMKYDLYLTASGII